jgi:hypothetical protein
MFTIAAFLGWILGLLVAVAPHHGRCRSGSTTSSSPTAPHVLAQGMAIPLTLARSYMYIRSNDLGMIIRGDVHFAELPVSLRMRTWARDSVSQTVAILRRTWPEYWHLHPKHAQIAPGKAHDT